MSSRKGPDAVRVDVIVYVDGKVAYGLDQFGGRVKPSDWDVHVISALSIANNN